MMIVATICLSSVALILMIRKDYLTFDKNKTKAKPIAMRRLSTSFAIALSLYLSYRLEIYDWPYTLAYYVALPLLWIVCTIVFWHVVDRVTKQPAATPVTAQPTGRATYQQSPVDRIYAWETQQTQQGG